jgi:hypothetical protein
MGERKQRDDEKDGRDDQQRPGNALPQPIVNARHHEQPDTADDGAGKL